MKFLLILLLWTMFRFGVVQQAQVSQRQTFNVVGQALAEERAAIAAEAEAQAAKAKAQAVEAQQKAAKVKAAARVLSPELQPGVPLKCDGKLIDVEIGHAAPLVADIKGDGSPYLLVGQFGEGKLRLYPMTKSGADYKLGKLEWHMAGGKQASVPTG